MIAGSVHRGTESLEQRCDPAADAAEPENANRTPTQHDRFQVQWLLIPVPAAAAHFSVVIGQFFGQVECQRQCQFCDSVRVGVCVADRNIALLYRSEIKGVHARPGDLNQLQLGRCLQKPLRDEGSEKYIGRPCQRAKRILIKGRRNNQLIASGDKAIQPVPDVLQVHRQHTAGQQDSALGHCSNLFIPSDWAQNESSFAQTLGS